MFSKSIVVLTIFRKKILSCRVQMNKKHSISQVFEYGWEPKTLDLIFEKIKKTYKVDSVRILLTREVCYVLKTTISQGLEGQDKREAILEKISERVPEVFGANDFDYKDLSTNPSDMEIDVLVFAPIVELTKSLQQAYIHTGLNVPAIEPEEISKTRNINPVIGIVLKEDLNGTDDETLNLSFTSSGKNMQTTKPAHNQLRLFSIVIIVTFIVGVIFYVLFEYKLIKLPFLS